MGVLLERSSRRRLAALAALVVSSGFAVALVLLRLVWTGELHYANLFWNLFLAWIPFVLSLVVYARAKAGASLRLLVPLGALWLVFFPNAPYLITDLKHLGPGGSVPLLYDVLLLSTAAWTGLLLGLTSLFLIHAVARRLLGAVNAWALVVGVLSLSSFGIYLGRVQRWNSWDVLVHPFPLAEQIASGLLDPLAHPRPIGLTILFTSFLLASYIVLYSFARLSPEWDALERPRA